jgi:hypothetical protein
MPKEPAPVRLDSITTEGTMSRISRRSFTLLAVVIAAMAPATSHAQIGGLKKKMKDKITGDAQPASTPATTTTPSDADAKARADAWQHPVAITSSAVDGFVKAIKAENAARTKWFASAPPSSAIAQWNAYHVAKAKCKADEANDDSTQARYQRTMMAEASAGHPDKIQTYTDSILAYSKLAQARSDRCSALVQPKFSDDDWKAVHAEEDKEEAAAASVGGFTPLVYSRLKERVIAYMMMPSGGKPSGYTADELHAIDARRAELKPLLGSDFDSNGQRRSLSS